MDRRQSNKPPGSVVTPDPVPIRCDRCGRTSREQGRCKLCRENCWCSTPGCVGVTIPLPEGPKQFWNHGETPIHGVCSSCCHGVRQTYRIQKAMVLFENIPRSWTPFNVTSLFPRTSHISQLLIVWGKFRNSAVLYLKGDRSQYAQEATDLLTDFQPITDDDGEVIRVSWLDPEKARAWLSSAETKLYDVGYQGKR